MKFILSIIVVSLLTACEGHNDSSHGLQGVYISSNGRQKLLFQDSSKFVFAYRERGDSKFKRWPQAEYRIVEGKIHFTSPGGFPMNYRFATNGDLMDQMGVIFVKVDSSSSDTQTKWTEDLDPGPVSMGDGERIPIPGLKADQKAIDWTEVLIKGRHKPNN